MHVSISTPTEEVKLWQIKEVLKICLGCAKNGVFFSAVSCKKYTPFLVHPKQIFGPSYFDSTLDIAMQHYILISYASYTAVRRRFTSNIDHVTNSIPSSFSRCLLGYCHRSLHASNWFAREIIGCPFTLLQRGQVVNQLGSPHITFYVLNRRILTH